MSRWKAYLRDQKLVVDQESFDGGFILNNWFVIDGNGMLIVMNYGGADGVFLRRKSRGQLLSIGQRYLLTFNRIFFRIYLTLLFVNNCQHLILLYQIHQQQQSFLLLRDKLCVYLGHV